MLSETTTRTLPLDTYPIRIAPDSVTPAIPNSADVPSVIVKAPVSVTVVKFT